MVQYKMGDVKMSSDEVPHKFLEWLLAMGCPPDKVPSEDKVSEMCRGQYYMVWRSLMEHAEPKDSIRSKRLQVFCDDMRRCQKRSFNERDVNAITPAELTLWKQHAELKEKMKVAEARLTNKRQDLNQIMDKISSKLSQRNTSRQHLQDLQRRVWFLQEVSEDLRNKKTQLEEARTIAESMSCVKSDFDIESNLDKCITIMSRHGQGLTKATLGPPGSSSLVSASVSLMLAANPVACSSFASTNSEHDIDEHLSYVVGARGDTVWPRLCERRKGLTAALSVPHDNTTRKCDRVTPQSVLAQTAALQCSLALEAMKNKVHLDQTGKMLAAAINEQSSILSAESCEVFVQRCERAHLQARVEAAREALEAAAERTGAFASGGPHSGGPIVGDSHAAASRCATLHKAIISKKAELQRLTSSMWMTERKIQVVRECLLTVFKGFHTEVSEQEYDKFKGQLELPQESILTLRQFYEGSRERTNKIELSMNLDVSDNCSFIDPTDINHPKFVEELRIYLKRFNLEKNRKLVLESGDKIWIFESLQSSLRSLQNKWLAEDISSSLMCPSVSLSQNLTRLIENVHQRDELQAILSKFDSETRVNLPIDIKSKTEEENNTIDKIKKRLNENLLSLQKAGKTLDLERENIRFWSDNQMKKHISNSRTVDGMTYKDCEAYYMENINHNI